ncbi:MAG: discoidin domain-containing protein [Lentisphaeraceae bacterium]|nr:discoidin domain-containing protein [Lentisphaeraceae bacterium]
MASALKEADPRLRRAAFRLAETLYKQGDKEIVSLLQVATDDTDTEVLSQYMLTLKYLKLPRWKEKLIALNEKTNSEVLTYIYSTVMYEKTKKVFTRQFSSAEKKLIKKGETIFTQLCSECHGQNARGKKSGTIMLAPSLLRSERVLGSKEAVANILLHGMIGKIDGKEYPGNIMVPMGSNNNEWVASVLSYLRASFGNNGSIITAKEVSVIRAASKDRQTPWKFSELKATHPSAILKRKRWKVTASHNIRFCENAIDENRGNRYDSGKKQALGMWFQIELPQPRELHGLVLDAAQSSADYPRGYKVQTSSDGKSWSEPVAQGEGRASLTSIKFTKAVTAKFVRISLTKDKKSKIWSIHDLYLIGK